MLVNYKPAEDCTRFRVWENCIRDRNKTLSRLTIKLQLFFWQFCTFFRKFNNVIWSVYNKSVTGKKDEFKFYEAPLIFFGLELGPNEGERGFIDSVVVLLDLYWVSLTIDQV